MIYRVTLACDIEADSNAEAIEHAAALHVKTDADVTVEAEVVGIEDEDWKAVT